MAARMMLDQVVYPLLVKASGQFAEADTPHERMGPVEDVVFFKVKASPLAGLPADAFCAVARFGIPLPARSRVGPGGMQLIALRRQLGCYPVLGRFDEY